MLDTLTQVLVSFATGFLIPLFLFTSSVKITRWHTGLATFQLGFMKKYGLNSAIYSLIGVAELLGALGLLLQGTHILGTLAAAGLILLSLGAFRYHLKFDSFQFGMPALLTAVLSAIIFAANLDFLGGLPENLAIGTDALAFNVSLATSIPAAVGLFLAFNFAKLMAATATSRLNDPDISDPYAV